LHLTTSHQIEAKYDKSLETGVRSWIEEKTGEKIGEDFQGGLKSGVILCKCVAHDVIPVLTAIGL
jgi:hypothetical protein